MGGSDPRKKQTTIIQGEKGKLALLRKRKSVPLKVAVKDPNNGDDDDNDEDQGKQHPPKKHVMTSRTSRCQVTTPTHEVNTSETKHKFIISSLIHSLNAFISSWSKKSLSGMASSFISITSIFVPPFQYRQQIVGFINDFTLATTHSCLSSLPNCTVVTTIVMTA